MSIVSSESAVQVARPRWRRRARRALLVLAVVLAAVLLLALALFALLKHRAQPRAGIGLEVSRPEREAEDARLAALGLQVPDGGLGLERPFAQPFSSRSLVVPQPWYPRSGLAVLAGYDLEVRASDLLADLDLLQPVMERAYGGWDSALRRGWSWDAWFDDWRAALRRHGAGTLSLDEAFAPFDRLIAFQRDNHSQIPLQRFATASASETYLLARAPTAPCTGLVTLTGARLGIDPGDPGQRVREALTLAPDGRALRPARYVVRPVQDGPLQAVECGPEVIPLEPSEPHRRTFTRLLLDEVLAGSSAKPEVRRLSDQVVYARVPSMVPEVYADLERRAPAWPKPTGQETLLLVDLRGNGGGDVGYGLRVLSDWVDQRRLVKLDQLGTRVTSSCLYAPLKWGFLRFFFGGSARALPRDEVEALQRGLDALLAPARPGCPREVTETPRSWAYTEHRLARGAPGLRVVVWTDSGCGSDCEALALQLASLPEAVLVGANTLGVGQFTQPGYGLLPHVRLPYRIALGESDVYGDRRSFDGYGLDVDVVLSRGDWSLERVEQLAHLLR
jgi:Peptidase family S41